MASDETTPVSGFSDPFVLTHEILYYKFQSPLVYVNIFALFSYFIDSQVCIIQTFK